jgi:hypothetical protein
MLTPLRFGTAPAFVRHATGQSRWTLPLHYYGFTSAWRRLDRGWIEFGGEFLWGGLAAQGLEHPQLRLGELVDSRGFAWRIHQVAYVVNR